MRARSTRVVCRRFGSQKRCYFAGIPGADTDGHVIAGAAENVFCEGVRILRAENARTATYSFEQFPLEGSKTLW